MAAFQWSETNRILLDDLAALPRERWCAVSYDELVSDPGAAIRQISAFAGVQAPDIPAGDLPLSRTTLTPPDSNKWRRHADTRGTRMHTQEMPPGVCAACLRN